MKSRLFHIFCASFSFCFSDYFFVVVSSYTREVLLIMAHTPAGKLRPKGVLFFIRLHRYERVGISLAEVYEIVGECVISVCKMV